MTSIEFWENLFSDLGFEKTVLADRLAFKIPICEAIYLCQVLGATEWRTKRESRGEAYIFLDNNQILVFPNPCPSVRIGDVTTEIKYQRSIEYQINPLLSPSLNFIREKHPNFFDNDFKYLMFYLGSGAVKDIAIEEKLNTSDIVSLDLPKIKEDMGEPLMTYIVSSFLRRKGFIVDPFNEALGTRGFPDLFAFKLPQIQNKLADLGIVEGGFYLNELELMGKKKKFTKVDEEKSIVIEIESPGKSRFYGGKDQVMKYLLDGYYNEGYVGVPFEEFRINSWAERGSLNVGAITINEKGQILMKGCPKNYGVGKNVLDVKKIVEQIIKLTLLKNLPLRQMLDLFPAARSFYDLHFAANELDIDEIISSIKQ